MKLEFRIRTRITITAESDDCSKSTEESAEGSAEESTENNDTEEGESSNDFSENTEEEQQDEEGGEVEEQQDEIPMAEAEVIDELARALVAAKKDMSFVQLNAKNQERKPNTEGGGRR